MSDILLQFFASPLLISFAAAWFLSACITTFDKRIIQAKRSGVLPPDHPNLPRWVIVFHFLDWVFLIALLLLNWKVGLIVWGIIFVLKIVPVLETLGNVMMSPFKGADRDRIL